MKFLAIVLMVLIVACTSSTDTKIKDDNASVENKSTKIVQSENKTEDDDYVEKPIDPKDIVPPMQAIKDLDKMIEGYHLGKDLSPEQLQENKTLKRRIIRGTFDIEELCRLSLGNHWNEISKEQQERFVGLMTKLLETKAIFSKEQLKGENKYYTIKYNEQRFDDKEKKKSTVVSKMHVPSEKIDLDITYKLLLTPYGWKIFDVIVDDASLLSNYKFQFDRIIQKNGFENLMGRMEKKLDEISK